MSYTVSDIGEGELEVKRSKFIGLVYPIASRDDVDSILADVRRRYANASHIIYAYRIGVNGAMEYYTDAGEPSGTAGAPILKLLSSMDVSNTLVVVVRYFGGTKLGTGGLVKAYSRVAKLAIDNAGLKPLVKMVRVRVCVPYNVFERLKAAVKDAGGKILTKSFGDDVEVVFEVPQHEFDRIKLTVANLTQGEALKSLKLMG